MSRCLANLLFIGYCAGIIASQYSIVIICSAGVAIGVLALVLCRPRVAVILVIFVMGVLRYQSVLHIDRHDAGGLVGKEVVIRGLVLEQPAVSGNQQVIILHRLMVDTEHFRHQLQIWAPAWPRITVGTELNVRCTPQAWPSNRRLQFWTHGIHASCTGTVLATAIVRPDWRIFLARIADRSRRILEGLFIVPRDALLVGILFGAQTNMPPTLTQSFRATGTSHIIALSGYNVTMIVGAMLAILDRWVSRRWSWLVALGIVVLFVIMTGASASVVRAAIMAGIVGLASAIGRPAAAWRLMVYAAGGMLIVNPLLLQHDLGFQLSFLATIGLVFFAKPMAERLPWVPQRWGIRESLATTLAAMLATEPLILAVFGRVSLIAPIINVLVLPWVPLTMAAGFLTLVIGSVVPMLAWVSVPMTDIFLRMIISIISFGAQIPGAYLPLPWWGSVLVTVSILALAIRLRIYAPVDR